MNAQEREAYDAAIGAVHAMHKMWLCLDQAADSWKAGKSDTPVNSQMIDEYGMTAKELAAKAIELHDQLMETAG